MALLSFTVMEDGRIEDIYTISGLCKSIEEECVEIVKNMPPWNQMFVFSIFASSDGKTISMSLYMFPCKKHNTVYN